MANSFVRVPPDSTGKLIDTWTTTTLGYHRQGIVIADPNTDANVVNISSRLRVPIETEQILDYDTGAGTANLSLIGIALPASGGPVAGGTSTNPLRIDPTGSTTQPVSGTVTATGPLTDAELRASPVEVDVTASVLPTGAAEEATLLAIGALLTSQLDDPTSALNKEATQVDVETNTQAAADVLGTTAGAAVITDANGTIQQYLRGIIKLAITAGGWLVTIAAKKILWDAAVVDGGDVLTTELNSLADGAYSALGTEIDNTSGLHKYGWLEINLASLNPTTSPYILLFMVPALDGTNYPDAPSSTNPGLQYLVAQVNVATGSATKRIATGKFELPPAKIKFALFNDVNVAFGATGNTVTLYTADDEIQ